MHCSSVGIEIWFLAAASAVLVYLFTFGARPFQQWLRSHRPSNLGLRVIPDHFFNESSLWSMRALAVVPAIMLFVAGLGVVCFFRGPG
jgi:H+/Cl- antiporter ClcA